MHMSVQYSEWCLYMYSLCMCIMDIYIYIHTYIHIYICANTHIISNIHTWHLMPFIYVSNMFVPSFFWCLLGVTVQGVCQWWQSMSGLNNVGGLPHQVLQTAWWFRIWAGQNMWKFIILGTTEFSPCLVVTIDRGTQIYPCVQPGDDPQGQATNYQDGPWQWWRTDTNMERKTKRCCAQIWNSGVADSSHFRVHGSCTHLGPGSVLLLGSHGNPTLQRFGGACG